MPHTVCETFDGQPVPPESVRRIACDAVIIPIVVDGDGVVLDHGHGRRMATRRATPGVTGHVPQLRLPRLHRAVRGLRRPSRHRMGATPRADQPRQPAATCATSTTTSCTKVAGTSSCSPTDASPCAAPTAACCSTAPRSTSPPTAAPGSPDPHRVSRRDRPVLRWLGDIDRRSASEYLVRLAGRHETLGSLCRRDRPDDRVIRVFRALPHAPATPMCPTPLLLRFQCSPPTGHHRLCDRPGGAAAVGARGRRSPRCAVRDSGRRSGIRVLGAARFGDAARFGMRYSDPSADATPPGTWRSEYRRPARPHQTLGCAPPTVSPLRQELFDTTGRRRPRRWTRSAGAAVPRGHGSPFEIRVSGATARRLPPHQHSDVPRRRSPPLLQELFDPPGTTGFRRWTPSAGAAVRRRDVSRSCRRRTTSG